MKEIIYSDLMSIKIGASEAEQSHVDGLIDISQGTTDLGANGPVIGKRQGVSFRLRRESETRAKCRKMANSRPRRSPARAVTGDAFRRRKRARGTTILIGIGKFGAVGIRNEAPERKGPSAPSSPERLTQEYTRDGPKTQGH